MWTNCDRSLVLLLSLLYLLWTSHWNTNKCVLFSFVIDKRVCALKKASQRFVSYKLCKTIDNGSIWALFSACTFKKSLFLTHKDAHRISYKTWNIFLYACCSKTIFSRFQNLEVTFLLYFLHNTQLWLKLLQK